jgi:hypothetical protein
LQSETPENRKLEKYICFILFYLFSFIVLFIYFLFHFHTFFFFFFFFLFAHTHTQSAVSALQKAHKLRHQFEQRQQVILDALTPHLLVRWGIAAALLLLYALRVYWLNGFYIISYGLAIYILNLLLGFLSPRVDPEFASLGIDEDEDDGSGVLLGTRSASSASPTGGAHSSGGGGVGVAGSAAPLPTHTDQEFKPFIRRLPEFKFWLAVARASLLSLVLTFFPFLDIPVFWPILVVYFFALFFVTMRKQIQHMIKHKYIPFSFGKPKFASASGGGQHHAPRRAD